jgi:hypothetical protein
VVQYRCWYLKLIRTFGKWHPNIEVTVKFSFRILVNIDHGNTQSDKNYALLSSRRSDFFGDNFLVDLTLEPLFIFCLIRCGLSAVLGAKQQQQPHHSGKVTHIHYHPPCLVRSPHPPHPPPHVRTAIRITSFDAVIFFFIVMLNT